MSKKDFPYYWRTKDGSMVKVDDMDIDHLRNVLKMLIRMASFHHHQAKPVKESDAITKSFVEEEIADDENHEYAEYFNRLRREKPGVPDTRHFKLIDDYDLPF